MKSQTILATVFFISACAVSQDQVPRGNTQGFGCAEPPVYPARAARECIEGSVTLEFSLNRQGYPEAIQIVESEPKGIFDAAAVRSLSSCRFKHTEENGGRVLQTIEFFFEDGVCASHN